MTHPFFCADVAREVGEDLIGSAAPANAFILIECPFPWKPEAFESKWIPQNLRELVAATKASGASVRFLLVNQTRTVSTASRVILYQRVAGGFCGGYQRSEWLVERPEAIAPLIQSHSFSKRPVPRTENPPVRDLLVCVHGSYDKCCGKYGLPFCREVRPLVEGIEGQSIRLWQTSHFGGHRFAPTLIDLPDGRYYGRMNAAALQAILTRSGEIGLLNTIYRGWSVLPPELQAAERALLQQYGWQGLDCKIAYRIESRSVKSSEIKAELSVLRSDGWIDIYVVAMVKDFCKTVCLRTSCRAVLESEQVKYVVKSLDYMNSLPWPSEKGERVGVGLV